MTDVDELLNFSDLPPLIEERPALTATKPVSPKTVSFVEPEAEAIVEPEDDANVPMDTSED